MDALDAVRLVMVRDLRAFQRELDLLPEDRLLWATVPGIANPVGNLALHVAGNLQHYLGAVLGGTGYRRQRSREFATREGSRAEVGAELVRAEVVVSEVLAGLDPGALDVAFPESPAGVQLPTGLFLQHLSAHLAFHLGQAGILRRALTGDPLSSDPVSLLDLGQALGEDARG